LQAGFLCSCDTISDGLHRRSARFRMQLWNLQVHQSVSFTLLARD